MVNKVESEKEQSQLSLIFKDLLNYLKFNKYANKKKLKNKNFKQSLGFILILF